MKKSTAAEALVRVLTRYNTGTPWYDEKKHAYEVINFLEEIGLIKPTHKKKVIRRDLELIPYEDTVTVEGWENE